MPAMPALAILPRLALAHRSAHPGAARLEAIRQLDSSRVTSASSRSSARPSSTSCAEWPRTPRRLSGSGRRLHAVALAQARERPRPTAAAAGRISPQDALHPPTSDFDEAIRLSPKDGDAFSGRALVRAHLGRHEGATSDAEYSLKCVRKNWRLAHNAARVYALSAVSLQDASRKTGGHDRARS